MGAVDANVNLHKSRGSVILRLTTIWFLSYYKTAGERAAVTTIYERTRSCENNEVAQTDHEMQAIIASLHAEKVVPGGSKR
ncbi:MAG: hypothetical protein JWL77_5816 [Chthonomonadaceae bacterium]|nr:hypothetical protein [Chthonomonadaceae bacterium]